MKQFFIFLSLNLFITLYYRAEHFRLFLEKTNLPNLTFYDYLYPALPQDIFVVVLLSIIGFFFYRLAKIFFFFLFFFLEILVILYYATALGYYKLYESLFEFSALRNFFSILPELIFSIQGELDHRTINFIFINLTLLTFFNIIKNFRLSHVFLSLIFVVTAFPQIYHIGEQSQEKILFKEELKNPIWQIGLLFRKKSSNLEPANTIFAQEANSLKKSHPPIAVPRKKYSVVFYFFESMSAKYLDFTYDGKEVCPNWLRLKRSSLVMKNHYANFPLSINSFFNVFCSLPALPDGRWLSLVKPDINHKCAAEILAEAGYKTAIFHAGDPDYAGQRRFYKYHPAHLILDNHDLQKTARKKSFLPWAAADERLFLEKAIEFARENKNFFITLFAFTPHHPYAIPEDFPKFIESIPENLPYHKKAFLNYLNSLHFADFVLGELIDQFEKQGLAEDTLFFLFADHGEAFYEHKGNFNHPYYLYQENVHVPFLIYNRKLFPNAVVVEKNTSHLDILPTLLDFLQIPQKNELWGKSILKGGKEEIIYLQTFWDKEWLGLVYGPHKYLYRPLDNRREFYDLSTDPMEKNNKWENYKNLAESYHTLLLLDKKRKEEFFKSYLGLR